MNLMTPSVTLLCRHLFIALSPPAASKGFEDRDYVEFISEVGGGLFFNGALWVLGEDVQDLPHLDREQVNMGVQRRFAFLPGIQDLNVFACDAFANLFAFDKPNNRIVLLSIEDGSVVFFAKNFADWASTILEDSDYITGQPYWLGMVMDRRASDSRIIGIRPFVLGGEYELQNFRLVPFDVALEQNASIATQILHLPEGSNITIQVRSEPAQGVLRDRHPDSS